MRPAFEHQNDLPDLVNCPFCGGPAGLADCPHSATAYYGGCLDDDCIGCGIVHAKDAPTAAAEWNQRADLSKTILGSVKPLQWEEVDGSQGQAWQAKTEFGASGRYTIQWQAGKKPWKLDGPGGKSDQLTLGDARYAGDLDFRFRVLRSLISPETAAPSAVLAPAE